MKRLFAGTLAAILLLGMLGCDPQDSDSGRYPPPDSADARALIEIEHQLREPTGADFSWAEVSLTDQGQGVIDGEVTVEGQRLEYDSRSGSFSGEIVPPLLPGSSIKVYLRSVHWGEDSTFVRLPGEFSLLDPVWNGDTLTVRWSSAEHARSWRISLTAPGTAANPVMAESDSSHRWLLPGNFSASELLVRVYADRRVSDAPVYSGQLTSWRERSIPLAP